MKKRRTDERTRRFDLVLPASSHTTFARGASASAPHPPPPFRAREFLPEHPSCMAARGCPPDGPEQHPRFDAALPSSEARLARRRRSRADASSSSPASADPRAAASLRAARQRRPPRRRASATDRARAYAPPSSPLPLLLPRRRFFVRLVRALRRLAERGAGTPIAQPWQGVLEHASPRRSSRWTSTRRASTRGGGGHRPDAPKDRAEALQRVRHADVVYRQNYVASFASPRLFHTAAGRCALVGLAALAAAASCASDATRQPHTHRTTA